MDFFRSVERVHEVIMRINMRFSLRIIILLCAVFSGLLLYYIYDGLPAYKFFKPSETSWSVLKSAQTVGESDVFQLNLDHCKIPHVPARSVAFQKHLGEHSKWTFDDCSKVPDFTSLEKNTLKLTDDSINVEDCCVHRIFRPFADPTDSFQIGKMCRKFDKQSRSLDVSDLEFLEVNCTKEKKTIHQNHIHIPLNSGILREKAKIWRQRKSSWGRHQKPTPPSIFVLIIDSISRTEMYRNLPQTANFLLDMGFVDFKGHHPVGEATLVNVIPMMVGTKAGDDFWKTFKVQPKTYWDNVPFLWKIFEKLQYITGYLEDLPLAGTFNYGGQRGFVFQPTDIYIRPIMLSFFQKLHYQYQVTRDMCVGHKGVGRFLFDYLYEVLVEFVDTPKFIINWPCWPQHESGNSLHSQDSNYLEFFQKINGAETCTEYESPNDILENTIFIVASDHSMNSHTYFQTTHEGLLERRNAVLMIRPSNKMVRENPDILKSLMLNSNGVTSHFDIYRTLLNVAKAADDYNQIFESADGESSENDKIPALGLDLFETMPQPRSCANASIPPTMCICDLPPPNVMLNVDPNLVTKDSKISLPTIENNSKLFLDESQYRFPFM